MPPKLLDIKVEVPVAVQPDEDVRTVVVQDAGTDDPLERFTFVHFYATALAVLLEVHLLSERKVAASASSLNGSKS